jgi:hypothetical protein
VGAAKDVKVFGCSDERAFGRPLGMIVRYYEDVPTYAWVRVSAARDAGDYFVFDAKRLGACSTDQAARAAVEQALGEVGS